MSDNKISLTAIVLTKNEESRISGCLLGLSWIQDILVIDNGSADNTINIVKKMGVEIIVEPCADFSYLRNLGAKKAQTDWILYIDTDESIPKALQEEITKIISSFNPQKDHHAYVLKRKNYYLGSAWPHEDGMIRLIYKKSLVTWQGKLHESAIVDGGAGELKNRCIHNTHRTLEEMVDKTNEWSEVESDNRIKQNHPPVAAWRIFRVFITAFFDSFVAQGGWKAGIVGIIESIYQGFSMFVTYAKLWEKQRDNVSKKI